MKRLLKIALTLGLIASVLVSSNVYAMPTVKTPEMPNNLSVSKTANNNYSIQVGANAVSVGSATTSFTPKITLPVWQGYAAMHNLDLQWLLLLMHLLQQE